MDVEVRKKKQKKMMKRLNMTIAYGSCGLACCNCCSFERSHQKFINTHFSVGIGNSSVSFCQHGFLYVRFGFEAQNLQTYLTHQPCGDNHSPPQISQTGNFSSQLFCVLSSFYNN